VWCLLTVLNDWRRVVLGSKNLVSLFLNGTFVLLIDFLCISIPLKTRWLNFHVQTSDTGLAAMKDKLERHNGVILKTRLVLSKIFAL